MYYKILLLCFIFFTPYHLTAKNHSSVSGGIVHPSFNSSVYQNPAGYPYNNKSKIVGELFIPDEGDSNAGGHFIYGDGTFGLSVGLRGTSDKSFFHYGMGILASDINTSLGLAGYTDSDGERSDFNTGVIIGQSSNFKLACTLYSLKGGPDGYGAGVEYTFSSTASIIFDASSDKELDAFRLKPGILFEVNKASLSLSYGFDTDKNNTWGGAMRKDFSASGSFVVNESFLLQAYYEQLAHIYLSVTYIF